MAVCIGDSHAVDRRLRVIFYIDYWCIDSQLSE